MSSWNIAYKTVINALQHHEELEDLHYTIKLENPKKKNFQSFKGFNIRWSLHKIKNKGQKDEYLTDMCLFCFKGRRRRRLLLRWWKTTAAGVSRDLWGGSGGEEGLFVQSKEGDRLLLRNQTRVLRPPYCVCVLKSCIYFILIKSKTFVLLRLFNNLKIKNKSDFKDI